MLSANSSMIIVSKTTNPRWTAPEVIKNSVMGPAGDGECGRCALPAWMYSSRAPGRNNKHLPCAKQRGCPASATTELKLGM
jgi:hypothetical protein